MNFRAQKSTYSLTNSVCASRLVPLLTGSDIEMNRSNSPQESLRIGSRVTAHSLSARSRAFSLRGEMYVYACSSATGSVTALSSRHNRTVWSDDISIRNSAVFPIPLPSAFQITH